MEQPGTSCLTRLHHPIVRAHGDLPIMQLAGNTPSVSPAGAKRARKHVVDTRNCTALLLAVAIRVTVRPSGCNATRRYILPRLLISFTHIFLLHTFLRRRDVNPSKTVVFVPLFTLPS